MALSRRIVEKVLTEENRPKKANFEDLKWGGGATDPAERNMGSVMSQTSRNLVR
jgi:hypothetical protein